MLVLTDEDRTLKPSQVQLEFSDASDPDARHRVTWESTERHEQIGVFGGGDDDDFPGFTVPARGTVTVEVRMAFTSDTEPGRITADAAVVQRLAAAKAREDDGDWVGESEDYTFTVVEGGPDGGTDVERAGPDGDADESGGTGTGPSELARTGRGSRPPRPEPRRVRCSRAVWRPWRAPAGSVAYGTDPPGSARSATFSSYVSATITAWTSRPTRHLAHRSVPASRSTAVSPSTTR